MDDVSSGCSESGWTTYFDQFSCYSCNRTCVTNCEVKCVFRNEDHEDGDEEEEDLSMVSDASSGPPNLQECESKAHGYGYLSAVSEQVKKSSKRSNPKESFSKKQEILCLDDTASSPAPPQNESTPYEDQERVFVAAHLKAETSSSSSRKHFGFLKSSKGKSGTFLGMKRN